MSYIRSGSNPEKLYIWGDENNVVHIRDGSIDENTIPSNIFHGLIRRWHNNFGEDTFYKMASVKEVWILENGINSPKVELSYNGWVYNMYYSTWCCIAYSNMIDINRHVPEKNKIILK